MRPLSASCSCWRPPASGAPPPAPDAVARIGGEEVRYAEFEALRQAHRGRHGGRAGQRRPVAALRSVPGRAAARPAGGGSRAGAGRRGAAGQRAAIEALLAAAACAGGRRPPRSPATTRPTARSSPGPSGCGCARSSPRTAATAERALREIGGGTDFEEVARRLSRDSERGRRAATRGSWRADDLPPSFADVIFSLKPGEVSRLVPAEYGFHIFQVTEREPAQVVPLEPRARDPRPSCASKAPTGSSGRWSRRPEAITM